MKIIRWVPGAVATPNPITIPTSAPDIQAILAAEITRVPAGLHNAADHTQAAIVAAVADHAVHGHDITTVAVGGGGGAFTDPAIAGPCESGGGGQVNAGAVDDLAAAQAHGAGGAPVAHGAGGDPVVAAVPTRLTTRTISLDVNTLLGDMVTLAYLEVGERVLVS